MKKTDKHEMYCGCRNCKRPEQKLPLLEQHKEPEKQRPTEGPNAVPPDGGGS
jgi:hypothetical protein